MTIGQRRRLQGLCRDCNDEPVPGRSLCLRHLDRNRAYQAKRQRGARPVCPDCGTVFAGLGRRCDGCFRNTRGGFTHSPLPPRTLVRCACGLVLMDQKSERDRHAKTCACAHYAPFTRAA